MDWQPIDFAQTASLGVFDRERGLAPSVPPSLVWTDDRPIRVLYMKGNVELPELSFNTNQFLSPRADMLIVDGDLTLDGDLDVEQMDVGTPGYLVVKGNMRARNLFVTQQFELVVWGNLELTGVLLADDHSSGTVTVAGQVTAPAAIVLDFPLKSTSVNGTLFAQDRHPYQNIHVGPSSLPDARRIMVEEEDVWGEFWLIGLPEGTTQDDIETREEAASYSILTAAALADYQGTGGDLSIKDLLRKHGVAGLRRGDTN